MGFASTVTPGPVDVIVFGSNLAIEGKARFLLRASFEKIQIVVSENEASLDTLADPGTPAGGTWRKILLDLLFSGGFLVLLICQSYHARSTFSELLVTNRAFFWNSIQHFLTISIDYEPK